MSNTTFTNCTSGDTIKSGDRYRLTFARSFLDSITPGDGLQTTYTRIQGGAIAIPISEPPLEDADVAVIDVRISMQAATLTLAQFANAMEDLSSFTTVQTIEKIGTTQQEMSTKLGAADRGASRDAAASDAAKQAAADNPFNKLTGAIKGAGVWLLVGLVLVAAIVVIPRVLPKRGAPSA